MRKGLAWAFLLIGVGYSLDVVRPSVVLTETNKSDEVVESTHDGETDKKPSQNSTSPPPVAKVDFQDNQPLSMYWYDGTHYRAGFFVRNDEPIESSVGFAVVLQDDKKSVLETEAEILQQKDSVAREQAQTIPSNRLGFVTIEIDVGRLELPLSGHLEMTAKAADRSAVYRFKVLKVPPGLPSNTATSLFTVSLISSLVMIAASLIWLKSTGIKFSQRMGPPSWNFGDSWGTNITVGGALLTTLLGFSALPEQTHYLNKTAYLCLSLIFAALITIAPSIYALLRTPVTVAGSSVPQYQGYVFSFTLASGVTVWGALGQLATVALLFEELANANEISRSMLLSLIVILCLVGVLLLAYGCRTVVDIANQQLSAVKSAVRKESALVEPPEGATVNVPLPSWSVL
jgi:hypothetical protein